MRKFLFISAAIITAIFIGYGFSHAYEASLKEVSATATEIKQYEMLEISAVVSNDCKNPFDYSQIDVAAEIKTPDNNTVKVSAFYTGSSDTWKMRYSPSKTGIFKYSVLINTSAGKSKRSAQKTFRVVQNRNSDGFIRKDPANPFYPVFDSGRVFLGIGHNIAWSTNNDLSAYEKFFKTFRDNGCNLTRIWLNTPWTFRIETDNLCSYHIPDSDKLDSLLKMAQRYGVYIILTMDSYSALMEETGSWDEEFWKRNPYNKTNGGPCENPSDFFTDNEARRCYKNRMRYIVSRFGHSPNILAFELWNEFDTPREWTEEMARYIKSINTHGQFLTTSLGYPWGNNFDESQIWSINDIDMIDRHVYGSWHNDTIIELVSVNRQLMKNHNKCLVNGEFGMDANKNDTNLDPEGNGVALHTSIWASIFSGSFSTPLNWWWIEYIKGRGLYFHYKYLADFLKKAKWYPKDIRPIHLEDVMVPEKDLVNPDISIPTQDAWGNTEYKEFTIHNNGDMYGGELNKYLHGALKKDIRIEPVINVNYPENGKFIIHIDMVSEEANLIITMDGKEVLDKPFPTGQGEGPWKRSLYRIDHKIYQCVYDTSVEIDIPKGEHSIKLSNTGKDWMSIKKISLTNYRTGGFANVRAFGIFTGKDFIIWMQNREYNWQNNRKGIKSSVVKNASINIPGIKSGKYTIEWWDTFSGKVIKINTVSAKPGGLIINIPDFSKDIACIIYGKDRK